jgi:hypothetical protein
MSPKFGKNASICLDTVMVYLYQLMSEFTRSAPN